MTIKNWPADERPREKLHSRGAAALSDAELLALCLGNGVRGRSAVDLGRDLLIAAGGLRALLERGTPTAVRGLGAAKKARLAAALELARRCLAEDLTCGEALCSPEETAAYLRARLRGYPYEVFACIFLDSRHRVIAFEELFRGSIAGASVHSREVVRACLRHNAAAVIFAHNHPSGNTEPSASDEAITAELRRALQLIDVRMLDHLIVGAGVPVSMAARGLL